MVVVGIGADGWDGLSGPARTAIASADAVIGSERQLAYLPAALPALRVPLPTRPAENLPALLETFTGLQVCVLASGDPMFYGIGVDPCSTSRTAVRGRRAAPVFGVVGLRATAAGAPRR